jgi:lactoylglutathione lyase
MQPKIALITILTDYVPDMLKFYTQVLGFSVKINMGQYVELENEGARFAICDREIMLKATGNSTYLKTPDGQAFELAFPCDSPEEVNQTYEWIVNKGAKPIQPPASMEWGQRTAFFADPDGNIHELFSEIKS